MNEVYFDNEVMNRVFRPKKNWVTNGEWDGFIV